MEIKILWHADLHRDELYAILQLRSAVFVVEQNCAYQDLDGLDQEAMHVLGYVGDDLVAYARILKPGAYYKEPAIGRVVTDPVYRTQKLGKRIFNASINECQKLFPGHDIKIMAQCYLTKFYKDFGFEITSEEFLEDGIPHVEMVLKGSAKST